MPQMKTQGLTAYLFVVDMVYSGVVEMPTDSEVADQLCGIGRGGYAGMVELRLMPPKRKGKYKVPEREQEACRLAFTTLRQRVAAELGDDADLLSFNSFVLEHTLCKISRMKGKGWIESLEPRIKLETDSLVRKWMQGDTGVVL